MMMRYTNAILAATSLLIAAPALADSAASAATSSILDSFTSLMVAAIPGIVLGGWAWFKAHAAQSASKWDDEAVALVEKIAQGVVDKKTQPVAGVDH
jgi:hypothetical protein